MIHQALHYLYFYSFAINHSKMSYRFKGAYAYIFNKRTLCEPYFLPPISASALPTPVVSRTDQDQTSIEVPLDLIRATNVIKMHFFFKMWENGVVFWHR